MQSRIFHSVIINSVAGVVFLLIIFLSGVQPAWALETVPSKIEVNGLFSIEKDELLYLLGIESGHLLTDLDISRGIKRAFQKGIFEEIVVETSDERPSVVIINVRERDVIESIEINGINGALKRFLQKKLSIKEDDQLRYGLLSTEKRKLETALSNKGYPDAVVGFRVIPVDEPYRVKMIVNVDASMPLIINQIDVCGSESIRDKVRSMLGVSIGSIYDQTVLRRNIKSIRRYLQGEGFIEPVVGPYSFDNASLQMCVYTGKLLKVKLDGNAFISEKDLRKTMTFVEAGSVNEGLIMESVNSMYGLYREKGFVNTQIAPFYSEGKKTVSVEFFIFEGRRAIVNSISITGTDISEKRLKEILSLDEGNPYNPDMVESDERRIRDFFIALGYSEAKVEPSKVELQDVQWWEQSRKPAFEGYDRRAEITMHIEPGERILIASVQVEGAEVVPFGQMLEAAGIKEGDPYNEVDISDAVRRTRNFCRSYGFYRCNVDVERQMTKSGLDLIFHVQEKKKYFLGKTIIRGNYDTKLDVIRREIDYKEGEPLDRSTLEETRRKLYRLQLFSRVDVDADVGDEEKADVVISVKEGKPGTFEFGFGYGEYEKYRGFLDLSYRNLFGMNREGSIRTEFSSLSSRYIATYLEPWFLEKPIVSRTFLLLESRKEKNIDTGEIRYRIRKYTASTGLEKQLTAHIKGTLYYEYTVAHTYDLQPDVILTREDTGTLAISSISPGAVYDTRDDPFNPTRGMFAGLTVKYASNTLLSETDFIKTTGQLSGYTSLSRRLILAASARGGAAHGFRDTEELPLVERFFLGGRSTVRGYDQDTLGPKGDKGTPVGGNFFVLGNIELRYLLTGNWRVVVFSDGGNVWILEKNVTLNDLKYTAGLGLQYNTPVGPLRLDYGHKLNREEGESAGEFHFSLGYAF